MAGMLPGVEAARRRRFHKNCRSEISPTSSARRPSLSLNTTTHEFLLNSSLQRNPINHKELYDESRLDTAAREAKKRLDERLQSQTKSGESCMKKIKPRMKSDSVAESSKSKGHGSKRLSWLKLMWRLSEEEECAVCLEAFKRRRRGGTLMQLPCAHSMLVAAVLASRRGRFYDSKTAELQSDSSTVGEGPIIFSKQQAMCDKSQLDAAKKRLDVKLHGPQPTSQTNRSPSKSKSRTLLEENQWRGSNPKFS
ncbi:hypothetical protein C2S52_004831 [Perilla frutescens var. hirtella]|nr:hypothetical protein C2S52_004831 [Perilla frutescens var. hirtella]